MKKLLASLITAAALGTAPAHAADDKAVAKFRACESSFRDAVKAARAASPAGYVPAPDRARKPRFMVDCLAK